MSHQDGLGSSAKNCIHKIRGSQVQDLMAKLAVIVPFLPLSLPYHELTSPEDYTPGEVAQDGGKHVLQESSILGHLRRIGALSADTTHAIELGAGTARLSERLQRVTENRLVHVLVDRQCFPKHCRDGTMRNRAPNANAVQRIVTDIAALDLDSSYGCEGQSCLCMSKHLCGPACDLAISWLGRSEYRPPFAFATCCHYLCTWESFAGADFWTRLGLTQQDFEVAVAASQWYSLKGETFDDSMPASADDCSNALPNLTAAAEAAACALAAHVVPPQNMSSDEFERTFTREEKAKLGDVLKRLLDLCRAAKMQEMGYEVELLRYTEQSIENRLLLARATELEST